MYELEQLVTSLQSHWSIVLYPEADFHREILAFQDNQCCHELTYLLHHDYYCVIITSISRDNIV